MLRPVPFLQELFREAVNIGVRLGIETGPRIAVPVPRAADAAPGLVDARIEASLPQAVQLVKPADTSADHQRIKFFNRVVLPG